MGVPPCQCAVQKGARRILHLVEFKRISLTGFRSCTSRSRYRSISKQTTRLVADDGLDVTERGYQGRYLLNTAYPFSLNTAYSTSNIDTAYRFWGASLPVRLPYEEVNYGRNVG
ncbi:hypothetical protein Tco_1021638, partial [Tanacetum coccineum]